MSVRLVAVCFATSDPAATGAFWAAVLGREIVQEPHGVLVPGDAAQVGLRFVTASADKPGPNRLHLHVTSGTVEDQERTVGTMLDNGARRRGTGALPFGRDVYMADPGGDEFCVIAPGNVYLAGCGPLGEVTCEGTPAAGRFWREVLGWSLVWEEGAQVAIQSPVGGTKIAWDGVPEPAAAGWNRQRFDLVASDPEMEAQRLQDLGATLLSDGSGLLVFADPDGSEYSLARG